ncbi:MAG: HlyD family efflux transporter periplasmic adaptor subunit [Candidatus Accumulibacter sp.]|nr:HlyD family efflux transporter periplasmic adaptor subunit [Accumulibacter sp.]
MIVAEAVFAPLREDLRLHDAAPDRDGAPAWSIQDPVSNRFYRIGWLEFECLLRWPGSPAQIADDISQNTPLAVDRETVENFGRFLERHRLLRPTPAKVRQMAAEAAKVGWRDWRWWLHHYLFIRIPLVRPQRLLTALLPWVRPLASPGGLALVLALGVLGVLLAARRWDEFTHALVDTLTWSGLGGFALALIVSKTLHELGHALVATRYGLRVAHMGLALVVLWPMLYTDTGEAWKLKSARQRLAVSSAGIVVELALAALATLCWALIDDGPARQAALYLATTVWLLTLAVNASPFMRFDGYFILSDALDFPNLHQRAGDLARAGLRRRLLGWQEADPETLSPAFRRTLIAFAWATWGYRLVVFTGIAVAVYLFFFKALGLVLFAVEIAWFIVLPIWRELVVWRARWRETPRRHARRLALLLAVPLVIGLIPQSPTIKAPAVAQPAHRQLVYPPFAARIDQLQPPGAVRTGQPLVRFAAPDLAPKAQLAAAGIDSLNSRLAGLTAESAGIEQQSATRERLGEKLAESQAVRQEAARLAIAADFDGEWVDVDPLLRPGSWVGTRTPVGLLVDRRQWIVDAYVDERQIGRLQTGAPARFRPRGAWSAIDATVSDIDSTRSPRLEHPLLDARHGGPIATQPGERASLPVDSLYRVRLTLNEPLSDNRETRGIALIDGQRSVPLWQGFKRLAAVIVRESGF